MRRSNNMRLSKKKSRKRVMYGGQHESRNTPLPIEQWLQDSSKYGGKKHANKPENARNKYYNIYTQNFNSIKQSLSKEKKTRKTQRPNNNRPSAHNNNFVSFGRNKRSKKRKQRKRK